MCYCSSHGNAGLSEPETTPDKLHAPRYLWGHGSVALKCLHGHWVLGASQTRCGLTFTKSQDHVLKVLLLLGNFTRLLQGRG